MKSINLSKTSKMPCKSWSLNAIKTCPGAVNKDGSLVPVCKGCYATGGNYNFPNVKEPRDSNQIGWKQETWIADMVSELDTERYFRWFDSGDMYHIELAEKIYRVMSLTPWVKHWLPTRMHKFAKFQDVINRMQSLQNVVVRLSADNINQIIDGQTTSMVIDHEDNLPNNVSLCEAFKREGKCGTCRACWSKDQKTIAYLAHGNKMLKVMKDVENAINKTAEILNNK